MKKKALILVLVLLVNLGAYARADAVVRLQGLIRAWANCEEIYVLPGESATMNVLTEATEGTVLSYAWELGLPGEYDEAVDDYPYVWTPIEGATEATYTTGAITGNTRYYCRVSDDYGNSEDLYFCISIDS